MSVLCLSLIPTKVSFQSLHLVLILMVSSYVLFLNLQPCVQQIGAKHHRFELAIWQKAIRRGEACFSKKKINCFLFPL